jgi:hypothetical protein
MLAGSQDSAPLTTALIGAVIAALGYVGKLAIDQFQAIRAARAARLASLAGLFTLLRASWVSFAIQNGHVQRLMDMLRARGVVQQVSPLGYEHTIAATFSSLNSEESDLHAIIRSITVHSLLPVNQALLDWVRQDIVFKGLSHSPGLAGDLARGLVHLHAHLSLWLSKYEAWIPGHPEHALVYMADEQEHGLGFPTGLDKLVDDALKNRSWFWS